mgnify:CR=1 FL=1
MSIAPTLALAISPLALLQSVTLVDGPEAAEAMLALADSLLGRRDTLPADLVEDIALKAFEHQGTELGRRLLVAEILGRAGADEFIALKVGAARAEAPCGLRAACRFVRVISCRKPG